MSENKERRSGDETPRAPVDNNNNNNNTFEVSHLPGTPDEQSLPASALDDGDNPNSPPPPVGDFLTPLPLTCLFLATSLTGSFVMMYALIIATAIPSITAAFSTIEDIDWYSTAYLFATCSVQPLVAKLYDHFRLKDIYVGSILIFEIGNVICGVAQTSPVFIGGRAIAGLGAAGLFTGGLVILTAATPPHKRPLVIGMGMGITILGGVVGPLVGGALTQHLGWRWCMWIFLPPGAVSALVFILIRVPEQRRKLPARAVFPGLHRTLDLVGFGLFAPAVIMLLLALSWGGGRHPWRSSTIIGLAIGGILLGCVFCVWASHLGQRALIPPNVFRRTFVYCGCAVAFLQVGAFATLGDYLPLWFQSVLGASPTNSGLMLLPTMVTQLLATIFCGLLFNKFGYAPAWAQAGNILTAVGSGLLTTFNPSTTQGEWIGYQILVGIGRGFVIQIPPIVLQNRLPGEELATGTALLVFFQYFGSAVFLCISKTTFLNRLADDLHTWAPGIDSQMVVSTGATELRQLVPPGQIDAVIMAYSDALVTTFWLSTAASIAAFFFAFGLGWNKVKMDRDKMMRSEKDDAGNGNGNGTHGLQGCSTRDQSQLESSEEGMFVRPSVTPMSKA